MRAWAAAALDVVCVLVFVALGIRTHQEPDALLRVAAPFLAALAVGWLIAIPVGPATSLRVGAVIWLVTLVGGMLLRRVAGDGTAVAFVLVAAAFLAAGFLGWRAVALLASRRADHGTVG